MHASEVLKLFQQISLPVETLDLVVQFSDLPGVLVDLLMKGRHIDRAEGATFQASVPVTRITCFGEKTAEY